jgi:GH24 family phage-related lysozyme (muramidase)
MNIKLEKRTYDYKKHIIHVLVAGAMALSWGTVAHVHTFMKDHLRTPARSRSNKSSLAPDDTILPIHKTDSVGPPPPFTAEETVVSEPAAPAAASAPAAAEATASLSTASLIPAIAAKAGISITHTKIDTSFIRKVEGSLLKAYVPLAGTSHSGPTVGDGFDLGQMHTAEFDKLPIEAGLKAKLRPYVGMTGFRAKNYLKSHPLTITPAEMKQLNVVAADKILKPLMRTYNKASGKSFLELPPEAQTAIFSYAYQNGPGFMHRSSNKQLWQYFVTQNWKKASSTLRGFKMYASRRIQEAHLLDHIA